MIVTALLLILLAFAKGAAKILLKRSCGKSVTEKVVSNV